MPDLPEFPTAIPGPGEPEGEQAGFKPWMQMPPPGMGGGGPAMRPTEQEATLPERMGQKLEPHELAEVIDHQSRLAHYPQVARFQTPDQGGELVVGSNEDAWRRFIAEQLYDTRRVTLEHFHLFEWFPLAPGRFYTEEAWTNRQEAAQMLVRRPDGSAFFTPYGKASMIRGGVGAVRLRPRLVGGVPHYFMTASATGVCHEGFPVLVKRSDFGKVKPAIKAAGAVPVTLRGEMKYLYDDLPSFFEGQSAIPQLYLHVDQLIPMSAARPDVNRFSIAVAVSFVGEVNKEEGLYATFASFDPGVAGDVGRVVNWIENFYVAGQYRGVVVTDFDEIQPRFPGAVFGLPDLMAGKLDSARVRQFLQEQGYSEEAGKKFFLVYKEINTQGGAYIEGDVHTGGGNFIGGDQLAGPGG